MDLKSPERGFYECSNVKTQVDIPLSYWFTFDVTILCKPTRVWFDAKIVSTYKSIIKCWFK